MQRGGIAIAGVVMLAVGFAVGRLTAPRFAAPPVHPAPVPAAAPQDRFDEWWYPGVDVFATTQSGPLQFALYTTSDDLETVATWYGERLGRPLEPSKYGFGGGGSEVGSASYADSFLPTPAADGSYRFRPVKIGVGARRSPWSIATVVVSRADGEDRTHIVVSFDSR